LDHFRDTSIGDKRDSRWDNPIKNEATGELDRPFCIWIIYFGKLHRPEVSGEPELRFADLGLACNTS
jgi:hypothetical protein